mgnify:CR=1 FL=1
MIITEALLNEKLKNTENIELPDSLKAENIAAALNNEAMWKPEEEKKPSARSRKRKIYSFVGCTFVVVR